MKHEHDNTHRRQASEPIPPSPTGHRLLFVAFTLLAFCLFAPTVMFPLVQQYGKTLEEESRLIGLNQEFERKVERREHHLDAFANDVTIIERLAILDLRYENPDEEILTVMPIAPAPTETSADTASAFQSELRTPATWPRRVRSAEAWAEQQGLIDLFLDPGLQPVFLLMSCGLIIAAFVLFAPRREKKRPPARLPARNRPAAMAIHRPSA